MPRAHAEKLANISGFYLAKTATIDTMEAAWQAMKVEYERIQPDSDDLNKNMQILYEGFANRNPERISTLAQVMVSYWLLFKIGSTCHTINRLLAATGSTDTTLCTRDNDLSWRDPRQDEDFPPNKNSPLMPISHLTALFCQNGTLPYQMRTDRELRSMLLRRRWGVAAILHSHRGSTALGFYAAVKGEHTTGKERRATVGDHLLELPEGHEYHSLVVDGLGFVHRDTHVREVMQHIVIELAMEAEHADRGIRLALT